MRKSLGQPVVIENVGGAAGSIGTGRVARATPDGYSIVLGNTSTHVMNGAFYSLTYDVLNDFAPISPLLTTPLILFAKKTMPANDLRELIDWLKDNSSKVSAGFGSVAFQVVNLAFQKQIGTRFTLVPYRGTAPGMQDLIAGQIDLYFTTPVELPRMRAGSVKAYATTGDTRLALAPDIPTSPRWDCHRFRSRTGTGFLHRRERHAISQTSSLRRLRTHSPIQRFGRSSPISAMRFSRASDKHRRRSARW
jgi:tripartite-type tricarboxylate transporter receptor subunit TctC